MINKSFKNENAKLYVVSTPIGNLGDMTQRAKDTISNCPIVLCEDTRVTGSLISKLELTKNRLVRFDSHTENRKFEEVIN
jgi:16S rRNA (cytidine1402-2'-O)-methyltransferase